MTEDRLIGVSDLAAILGRPQRTLGEWRNKQKISEQDPRPVIPDSEILVDGRGTLIWRASHVLAALTEAGRYDGPIPEPMDLPDLVSLDYVCERTGKTRRQSQWLLDPRAGIRLPEPEYRISGCPCWLRSTIDSWMVEFAALSTPKVREALEATLGPRPDLTSRGTYQETPA